ncbi:MAG: class I SAM-dependent methyltransferase [Actinomycetes bacterium]
MTEGQGEMLWRCASAVPAGGRIVEIGSYHGRSAVILARAADSTVEINAIDPHAGNDRGPLQIVGSSDEGESDHQIFHASLNSAGVADRVRHVRLPSQSAHGSVVGTIDLLYVDGAHGYGPAMADIRDWGHRVTPAGTMLIHDSFSAIGVTLAQLRLLFLSREWRYVGRSRSMAEYQRASLTSAQQAENLLAQTRELGWFAVNVARKVLLVAGLRSIAKLLDGGRGEWPY